MHRNGAAAGRDPFASMARQLRGMRDPRELEQCLAGFARALRAHPAQASLRHLSGLALLGLGRPEEALDSFRRALALEPDRPEILDSCGEALMALSRFGEAAETYAALRRAQPGRPEGYDGLARALYRQGRHELCLAACELALGRFPGRPNMQNLQGMALLALSRCEEAGALYSELRDAHPELPWGFDGHAESLARRQRWEEALEAYSLALEKFPGRPEVLALKGRVLLGLSRLQEAAELFGALAQGNPELPLAHDGLIEACFRLRRWEDCLAACRRAEERFPGRAAVLDHMGYALMRLCRFAELKDWLEGQFARAGVSRLPLASGAFFAAHPQITPSLAELYAKACLACGEAHKAAALMDDLHHYQQEGAAKAALYGEYAPLVPHFSNSVLGVNL